MDDFALLLAGMALAALGGEVFVRGTVGVAARLRVPVGIVGVTIAAFATSAPEMAVGVNAAVAGAPVVAVGDALGSNVVNIALILGIVSLLAPLTLSRRDVRRDLPAALAAPLVLGLLTLDGRLDRTDGAVMVTVFFAWMGTTVRHAVDARDGTIGPAEDRHRHAWLLTVGGVALLLLAGRLVVVAARGIGETLGWDPFLVGSTIVALGTSMPELATAVVARVRGHGDLGASTVIGSNIFNTLWIVGAVALIRPFSLHVDEILVAVIAGVAAAALLIPPRSLTLGRRRGAVLIGGYAGYLGWLALRSA